MKYFFVVILVLLLSSCATNRFENERNYTIEEYNLEEDLALIEDARKQRESISSAANETSVSSKESEENDLCAETLDDVKNMIQSSTQCVRHSDCDLVTIEFGCIGNSIPVNKQSVLSVVPMLKFLDEHCDVRKCRYGNAHLKAGCFNYECKAVQS